MLKSILLQVIGKRSIRMMLPFFLLFNYGYGQSDERGNYIINYTFSDDSAKLNKQGLIFQTRFTDSAEVVQFAKKLMQDIRSLGYFTASIDSIFLGRETGSLKIFVGRYFPLKWTPDLPAYLQHLTSSRELKEMDAWKSWRILRERLLDYCENNGHPFAEVYLDNIQHKNDSIFAFLRVREGVLYHIDSIRLYGKLNIKNRILQQQTGITAGSIYQQKKINEVDRRLMNFPFAVKFQNADMTFLGSGGTLNLYLKPKKCSQFDVMLGIQPSASASGKVQLIGNVQLDLKNSFGNAEKIFLQWQQLQMKSPRLQLAYAQPYLLGTKYGIETEFGLFRKDSSFLQWQTSFLLSSEHLRYVTKIGFHYRQTNMLSGSIDTIRLRSENRIPEDVDSKSMNALLAISGNTTNHPTNPRKGWEYQGQVVSGKRTISINSTLLSIKETRNYVTRYYDSVGLSSYQARITGGFQHYIPLKKYSVITWGGRWGAFFSPMMFRNDLFQIGGSKLLRGFDEESIFANKYLLATLEYRFQLSDDGYFQVFTDLAHVENRMKDQFKNTSYWGSGLGLMYPTENGRISMVLATGVRSDLPFQWRQSLRVHLGYVSFF